MIFLERREQFVKNALTVIGFALLSAASSMAHADSDSKWWVRLGPGYIDFDEDVTLKAFGNEIPGAHAEMKDNTTFLTEIGYRLSRDWSVGLTLGYPPKTELSGTGTAEGLGKLGEGRYGPAALSLQYQFNSGGAFRPYLGGGLSYLKILSSEDAAVQNLDVDDTWGPFFQVGAEYWVSESYGLFIDVKKFYLETEATGNLHGVPVKADITFDPVVVHTGVSIRF